MLIKIFKYYICILKIVNPVTKRKVNINGKLGKKILANYVSILNLRCFT